MKKKILVVDDDPDILIGISILLESVGYCVSTTTKGNETYKNIKQFSPDLILLDILMSGDDGRHICKNLTDDEKYSGIPIVMISAEPSLKKDSLLCGAKDFLAKPFETNDLFKIVAKYC